ncbi:MAG: hypothetical protein RMI79_06225 [Nitrososphaerota archaeon]|nr:hypothetical protein [Nitrososphaerota archaeon]
MDERLRINKALGVDTANVSLGLRGGYLPENKILPFIYIFLQKFICKIPCKIPIKYDTLLHK